MSTTEAKAVKTESEKSQSSKSPNFPKHASDTGNKHAHKEKEVSRSNEKMVSEKSTEPKTKSQGAPSAAGGSVAAGVTVTAALEKADDKKKEKKSLTPASPVESKVKKPSDKSDMDALDDLIDTLGEPEDTRKDDSWYTGPVVLDPMDSTYLEALGIREGTIPPEYRELLAKKEGITGPPSDSPKPMGPDDAIDALSSDFTCSSLTEKQAKEEKSTGDVSKAQFAGVTRSAVPPQEKKRKVEEGVMSDEALQALSESLGTRQPDPECHISQDDEVKEELCLSLNWPRSTMGQFLSSTFWEGSPAAVWHEKLHDAEHKGDGETIPALQDHVMCSEEREHGSRYCEAKTKEERQEKCGEDDNTVPSEYRLKPAMHLSEAELIGQLSEDFGRSTYKDKPSIPAEKIEKSKDTSPTVSETVPQASMCSMQAAPPKAASSKDMVPDDAVETLAGSLGKRETNPEDEQPVVDKVKEKAKEDDLEKLGEKEETIPPDYRLEEFKPLSNELLLDALSQDFSSSTNISVEFDDTKLSAAISEVVSQTPAPSTHAAAPDTEHGDKELDDALDELSDSLGQRQPDPDENKPVDDKVKEKIKAEHKEKLGERDDTIPPEYRHLLDNDGQKPAHDQDPIDALSEDLNSCPSTAETSQNTAKEKSKKMGSSSKAPKNGVKPKNSSKKTEEASGPKADKKES
ncbi:hypothetical protein U0070_015961 [Myodes glareolus]|uniref:Calpastatin n=1 Tax=Myodes glareolus TaxID=447135 RepID=A0AAW0I243_MYOGA